MTTQNQDWKEQLRKQAAPQEAPKDAIAEAFAQQAYTSIENRSGLLMTDPYLLGFEIIERNEGNNRLVGAFAFRVGEELLLAPVFFLNGTLKGQYLLYRKTKDKFCPNNKFQIRAIMAEAEALSEGEPIDRNATHGATMEFESRALAAPPRKFASDNRELILELWKDATEAAAKSVETSPVLKQFLVDHPEFKEKAASLIQEDDEFAQAVVISRALDADVIGKQAAEDRGPLLQIVTEMPEDHEKLASVQDSLFKRGYAIEDNRSAEDALEAVCCDDFQEDSLRTTPHNSIDYALDHSGSPVKVLCAPVAGRSRSGMDLIVLEGKDKGKCADIARSPELYDSPTECEPCGHSRLRNAVFTDNKAVTEDEQEEAIMGVGTDKPKAGKCYRVFISSLGKLAGNGKIRVEKVEKDGKDITIVRTKYDGDIILRSDLEETTQGDAAGCAGGTCTYGKDARWIEVEDSYEAPALLDASDLWNHVISNNSRGKMKAGSVNGQLYLRHLNRVKQYDTESSMALKLASLGLGVDHAYSIVDRAASGETFEFDIVPPLTKLAHVWYEREPDMENDFVPTGYDSDFGIRIDDMTGVPIQYGTRRDRQTRPESRYLDAAVPLGSGATADHLPDEVLLSMSNPAQELSQAAQNSGLDHLIDHGALGSLVKTFDAVALATSYLDKIEDGVDALGRIVFLILWKPADFAEKFGDNDMPHLENTLVSAFEKHGDLVLELRQHAGNE